MNKTVLAYALLFAFLTNTVLLINLFKPQLNVQDITLQWENMSHIPVSVVIPVYNSEKYIVPCLESLYKQTLPNIELIFVSDRGTDNSVSIIENYISSHTISGSAYVLRNPRNLGPGPTRNAGIEAAHGEYVGIIDPDDWISPTFYEELYRAATAKKGRPYDEAKGVLIHYHSKRYRYSRHTTLPVKKRKPYVYERFHCQHVTGIFRRDLLVKHPDARYANLTIGEDIMFLLSTGFYASNITFTNKAKYYYRIRDGSLSNQDKAKNYKGVLEVLAAIRNFCIKHTTSSYSFRDYMVAQRKVAIMNKKTIGKLYRSTGNKDFSELFNEYSNLIESMDLYIKAN